MRETVLHMFIDSLVVDFQHALPHLRKTKGNIIQTASIGGWTGEPGGIPYTATKVPYLREKLNLCYFVSKQEIY